MYHNYYNYNKQQLLSNPRIPIIVMRDNPTVFQALADEMINAVLQNNAVGKQTVFICPVGPVGHYPYFVSRVNKESISLKNVWIINMDEYLNDDMQWIDKENNLSFRGIMDRKVYNNIRSELLMPAEQRVFPDPNHPELILQIINELGGVDICFGGIGITGHVAFNEPEPDMSMSDFLNLGTRVLEISKETRAVNSISDLNGNLEDMPKYCITIGMKEIFAAKKIRLCCFRDWHRAVVRRAAHGETTSEFPVTLLRQHNDINLRITDFVADIC